MGSGKTHSMNGVMDHLLQSPSLFNRNDGKENVDTGTTVSFSYIEILGSFINDCLGPNDSRSSERPSNDKDTKIAIGETMDGRVVVSNVSSHIVHSPKELSTLVETAKLVRSTAATEKNDRFSGKRTSVRPSGP